jgi:SagB-type dehydrogenase family enzyme
MNIFARVSRKDPNRRAYENQLFTTAELYHEASKICPETFLATTRRIRELIDKKFFLKLITRSYKTYPTSKSIALPKVLHDTNLSKNLRETILKRRSTRKYKQAPIDLDALTAILFNAYGCEASTYIGPGIKQRLRTVPSGGALYPLELYVATHNVEGMETGVYHYNVEAHSLELVRAGQFNKQLGGALFYEEMFEHVAATLIITGRVKRSFIKYGERAYRFMLIEAGHVGQNISLTSAALDLGCLMMGGFYDDEIDSIVGIDGVDETTLYLAALGKSADDRVQTQTGAEDHSSRPKILDT